MYRGNRYRPILQPETAGKSEVAQYFKKLEPYGYKVFNFQSKRAAASGSVGMTDLLICGRKLFERFFIEIKIGKDRLNEAQLKVKELLEPSGQYFIATELNYKEIFDHILTGWPYKQHSHALEHAKFQTETALEATNMGQVGENTKRAKIELIEKTSEKL